MAASAQDALPLPLQLFVRAWAGWTNREFQAALRYVYEENLVLREHVTRLRFEDDDRRLIGALGHLLGWRAVAELATTVTPETVFRWYRELVAEKYTPHQRGPRRPARTQEQIDAFAVEVARGNPHWSNARISAYLRSQGVALTPGEVAGVLEEYGVESAPRPQPNLAWAKLLARPGSFGADFLTVEVVTFRGLSRYYVFVLIEIRTRRIEIAGVTEGRTCEWMCRVARQLCGRGGFLSSARRLVIDNAPSYTPAFGKILARAGVQVLKIAPACPNMNAHVERLVRTLRSELLDHVVPLGVRHLRRVLDLFVEHYHAERPHQSLGNRLVEADACAAPHDPSQGLVVRRRSSPLGDLLPFYVWRLAGRPEPASQPSAEPALRARPRGRSLPAALDDGGLRFLYRTARYVGFSNTAELPRARLSLWFLPLLVYLYSAANRLRQRAALAFLSAERQVLRRLAGDLTLDRGQRARLAIRAAELDDDDLLGRVATLATPTQLRQWHEDLLTRRSQRARRGGRPRTPPEVEVLVVKLAVENESWGYRRIQGTLLYLGYELSKSTVARILERNGMNPAPFRRRGMTWTTFAKIHAEALRELWRYTCVYGSARLAELRLVLWLTLDACRRGYNPTRRSLRPSRTEADPVIRLPLTPRGEVISFETYAKRASERQHRVLRPPDLARAA